MSTCWSDDSNVGSTLTIPPSPKVWSRSPAVANAAVDCASTSTDTSAIARLNLLPIVSATPRLVGLAVCPLAVRVAHTGLLARSRPGVTRASLRGAGRHQRAAHDVPVARRPGRVAGEERDDRLGRLHDDVGPVGRDDLVAGDPVHAADALHREDDLVALDERVEVAERLRVRHAVSGDDDVAARATRH